MTVSSIPPTDPAPLPILEGIDVSGNNINLHAVPTPIDIDANKVVQEGRKSFVVLKCTEGVNWIDPHYPYLRDKFIAAEIPTMTIYHYLRLRHGHPQDADLQLTQAWTQYKKLQDSSDNELPRMWCDIELNENFGPLLLTSAVTQLQGEWRDCIHMACDTMKKLSDQDGLKLPAIYTDDGEWSSLGGNKIIEAVDFPLVLAAFTSSLTPHVMPPWSDLYLHQYGGDVGNIGTCPGVPGHCDLDRFRGTLDEFRSR